jgi:hypothetical protein
MDQHVARIGELLNAYDITTKKTVGMDHLEDLGIDEKIILKKLFKNMIL